MATADWFKSLLDLRGAEYQDRRDKVALRVHEACLRGPVGAEVPTKKVVMADGRPGGLIRSSSRHVVLDRVRNLHGADVVCLGPESEFEGILADRRTAGTAPATGHEPIAMLIDASLLSAGDLVPRAGTLDGTMRLTFEDWLSLANPGVGSFNEPDHDSSQAFF